MNPIESIKVRFKYFLYMEMLRLSNKKAYEHELKRKRGELTFVDLLNANELPRCQYAYGLYHAAQQAIACDEHEITAIEFGVAGGNGLVVMEQHAITIEKETGVKIRVFGFDSGKGMPAPTDYRDTPYIWEEGFFDMDEEKLRSRLTKATLCLGPVEESVVEFAARDDIPPIGFIGFDLDYYSSTVAAFKLLESSHDKYLPRVLCYFDDIIGDDWEMHTEFTGELLAIKEFNHSHEKRKIAPIANLRHKRIIPARWNELIFTFQLFDHPKFAARKGKRSTWEMDLT